MNVDVPPVSSASSSVAALLALLWPSLDPELRLFSLEATYRLQIISLILSHHG